MNYQDEKVLEIVQAILENGKLSLVNILGGAAVEMFDNSLAKVLENIQDINTTLKARSITLEVVIQPADENRHMLAYGLRCKAKLEGQEPVKGFAQLRLDHRGRVYAEDQVNNQRELPFNSNVRPMEGGQND